MKDYEIVIRTINNKCRVLTFTLEDDQYISGMELSTGDGIVLALPIQLNGDEPWLDNEDDCDTDDDYADAMTPDEVWTEGGIKD